MTVRESDSDADTGIAFAVEVRSVGPCVRTSRAEGARLPPGMAQAARQIAREAAADFAKLRPDDPMIVRLLPSEETARRLAEGTAEFVPKRSSEHAMAMVRDVASKELNENVEFEPMRRQGKHPRAHVAASMAWQAAAVATQQHYLIEISSRLGALEQAVEQLGREAEDSDVAELVTAAKDLRRLEDYLDSGAPTSDADLSWAQQTFSEAERIAAKRLEQVGALVAEADASSDGPRHALRRLAIAKHALAVAAQAALFVTRWPDADPERAVVDLEHYGTRLEALRTGANDAALELHALGERLETTWQRHERARRHLGSNLRNLRSPLRSLAAAPVVGDRYVAARDAVRELARREEKPVERLTFTPIQPGDLRRPKQVPRFSEEEREVVAEWADGAAPAVLGYVEVLVDGDEVRVLTAGFAPEIPSRP